MGFLSSLFGKKDSPITTNTDFWNWFVKNEKTFFRVVKNQDDIVRKFLDKLGLKLSELREGYFYLSGMYDDDIAELIITAEGIISNIVFVEELIKEAPDLPNWRFTALKPPGDIENANIAMDGYEFNGETLSFYSINHDAQPDEIDIVIVHKDYNESDSRMITNGVYIFLDVYLGELNAVTQIDNLKVVGGDRLSEELVPIEKLKDFLKWREKEFIEKYEGIRKETDNDTYISLEANLKNGLPLVAVVNSSLLDWDRKASHPWIMIITIKYDGVSTNGMPDASTSGLLNAIEEDVMEELKDVDGYLNFGRQTADSERVIFYACIEFRKPSKVLCRTQGEFEGRLEISFDIYKDKYWQTFERFRAG